LRCARPQSRDKVCKINDSPPGRQVNGIVVGRGSTNG
jgi:hypothetical protein